MNEKLIEEAKLYIQEIFKNNSDGHDANHSLRVYKNALQIAKEYPHFSLFANIKNRLFVTKRRIYPRYHSNWLKTHFII